MSKSESQTTETVQWRPNLRWPPLEPTEAMLIAARDWSAKKYGKPIGDEAARECWRAMLEAITHD